MRVRTRASGTTPPWALVLLGLTLLVPVGATGATPSPPQELFADLFTAVQSAAVFADNKTFPDAVPRSSPQSILRRFHAEHPHTTAALRQFVERNFIVEGNIVPGGPVPSVDPAVQIVGHIDQLWPKLVRDTSRAPRYSSALTVPRPYVVPGGRFRELYYWDSYFTMLGLEQSNRRDLVRYMVGDFASLIDRYGHIPNGTRSYYLGRSQPPFFFEMVALLEPDDPAAAWARYLPQMKREYAFWMEGAAALAGPGAHRRVVRLAGGAVLNRYWDDLDAPRDESWREDVALAHASAREPAQLYRDLRAAAESGWDFSSRWLHDPQSLASIETTQILPVDLNSLLFGLERAIRAGCERVADKTCTADFTQRAAARHQAIDRYLWDDEKGFYQDYRWTDARHTEVLSAATVYPLFESLASTTQALRVAAVVRASLLERGGLGTTTHATGQQWDAPNGWAPLQWIAVRGLRTAGDAPLAAAIACRWLVTVTSVYARSGRLVEKYDVLSSAGGGGGEYPLQDGFGWTNGVTRKLLVLYPTFASLATVAQCPTPTGK